MEIIDWSLLALCIGASTLVALVLYHAVAGYYYYRYYVRRRDKPEIWKCQPTRFLTPKQHRTALLTGTRTLTLGGVSTGLLVYGMMVGWVKTAIYTDVAAYGWAYTIGMTVVLFVLMDYCVYWAHRMLHLTFFYKHFHYIHHSFVATSPYVTTAFHPVEMFMLQTATFLPLFFIPLHAVSVGGILLYALIFNITDHSGVRLVSALPWQGPTAFHDDHHLHFHVNFGQHLMIWDRLHGTLRRRDRRDGQDVFGGRGAPDGTYGNRPVELEPFVSY